jgi:hypothetical protein
MAQRDDERQIWRVGTIECVMVSCCAGAELQLRRSADGTDTATVDIILRELYPMKSDLYDRARQLEAEYRAATP